MSRRGPVELALHALGVVGAARVLLGGLLLGGLLLAATGPPLDDPYALLWGLGVAAPALVGLLVVQVAPALQRRSAVLRHRAGRSAPAGAGQAAVHPAPA